jgi:hypothetical protein
MKYSLLFIFLFFGCTSKIVQYLNNDAPFASFEKFILIGMKGRNINQTEGDQDILPRIENAITEEMKRRNYGMDSSNPDLIVRYEIVSGTVPQRNQTNNMYGFTSGVPSIYNYNTVIESVLLIEILSVNNQKLVWQASIDLKDHSKKTKRKDVLAAAVEKLFDTYLYEAGKSQPVQTIKTTQ